ncbi:MAG TPA: glycosyltransferase family 2 protein [Verrucomicrobiae bacterium]|nr:glycosyltransferase family 2 protein [Verrucomicrobiae bacterium]
MNIDISIVILSWNDREHLQGLLHSLRHCTRSRRVELIVVDNASTDGSPDMVELEFPAARVVRNHENLGFPRGNNLGIRLSRGKYIFVLNSDIKVLEGCVDALADYLDVNTEVGMLGPKILNADLSLQSSCRKFPTLWNNFCVATGLATTFKRSRIFSGEHMLYFRGDQTRDVDVLVGCFWVVRREALDEFGLLDEGFFIYAEDVDWCKRCWKSGWRVVFFPGAQAIHYRGASTTKKDPVRFALTQQQSVLRYWKKHHSIFGRAGIRFIIFIHLSLRWLASVVKYFIRRQHEEINVRLDVTSACLRALFATQTSK